MTTTDDQVLVVRALRLGDADAWGRLPMPQRRGTLLARDLNGDGRPDLVAIGGGERATSVVVSLADDAGRFAEAVTYPAPDGASGLALADLDADGRPDLAVVSTAGTAWILRSVPASSGRRCEAITTLPSRRRHGGDLSPLDQDDAAQHPPG